MSPWLGGELLRLGGTEPGPQLFPFVPGDCLVYVKTKQSALVISATKPESPHDGSLTQHIVILYDDMKGRCFVHASVWPESFRGWVRL